MTASSIAESAFLWAREHLADGALDDRRLVRRARPDLRVRLRGRLPSDREEARRVRDDLPPAWRSALDALLRDEPRPRIVGALLLERLERREGSVCSEYAEEPTLHFSSPERLREAIREVGLRAIALATAQLDRRERLRLAHRLPPDSRGVILDGFGEAVGEAAGEVAHAITRDAFVKLARFEGRSEDEPEDELAGRADRLGAFVLAFATSDDRRSNDAIAALLDERDRDRFRDFTAAARRSSRRAGAADLRTFVEGVIDDR